MRLPQVTRDPTWDDADAANSRHLGRCSLEPARSTFLSIPLWRIARDWTYHYLCFWLVVRI